VIEAASEKLRRLKRDFTNVAVADFSPRPLSREGRLTFKPEPTCSSALKSSNQ
jgi:hypothetical protein